MVYSRHAVELFARQADQRLDAIARQGWVLRSGCGTVTRMPKRQRHSFQQQRRIGSQRRLPVRLRQGQYRRLCPQGPSHPRASTPRLRRDEKNRANRCSSCSPAPLPQHPVRWEAHSENCQKALASPAQLASVRPSRVPMVLRAQDKLGRRAGRTLDLLRCPSGGGAPN